MTSPPIGSLKVDRAVRHIGWEEPGGNRNNILRDGTDEAVQRLTEAQKECLRLVMAGFKSKEIAHQLGIGVDAVNKRLAAATATLEVSSRFIAARRLATVEAEDGSYHSLVGQTLAVEPQAITVNPEGIAEPDESPDETDSTTQVEEPQVPYSVVLLASASDPQSPATPDPSIFTPVRVFLLALLAGAALELATRV